MIMPCMKAVYINTWERAQDSLDNYMTSVKTRNKSLNTDITGEFEGRNKECW